MNYLIDRLPAPLRALAYDAAENSIMQTITIAVSAILIASGLVTAPGLINNARDNNAKTDLANVAYAQEFYLADQGRYAADLAQIQVLYSGHATNVVASTGPALTLSGGVEFAMNVSASGDAYLMAAASSSGNIFYRSSGSAVTSSDLADIETHGLAVPVPGSTGPEAPDEPSAAELAADAGVAAARAGLQAGTCVANQSGRYLGANPQFQATIWVPSDGTWVRACPVNVLTEIRILSVGLADGQTVTVEVILSAGVDSESERTVVSRTVTEG